MRVLLLIFLTLRFTSPMVFAEPEADYYIYSIPSGGMEKSQELVKPLLSHQGYMTVDAAKGRLIVFDIPSVQVKIATLLKPWVPTPKNVRIQVSSQSPRSTQSSGYSVTGSGKVGGVTVQSGRSGPIEIKAHELMIQNDVNATTSLLVRSGGKGYLTVAEQVPEVTWLAQWSPHYTVLNSYLSWKDIGSKLVVEPQVLSNGLIKVRLTPSFSYILKDRRMTTEIQELSTEVTVAEGSEIDLGGMDFSSKEFSSSFFLSKDVTGHSRPVRFKLRATVEELSPKP